MLISVFAFSLIWSASGRHRLHFPAAGVKAGAWPTMFQLMLNVPPASLIFQISFDNVVEFSYFLSRKSWFWFLNLFFHSGSPIPVYSLVHNSSGLIWPFLSMLHFLPGSIRPWDTLRLLRRCISFFLGCLLGQDLPVVRSDYWLHASHAAVTDF